MLQFKPIMFDELNYAVSAVLCNLHKIIVPGLYTQFKSYDQLANLEKIKFKSLIVVVTKMSSMSSPKRKELDVDDYVPYVPIKKRRESKLQKLASQRRIPEPQKDSEVDDETEESVKAGPKANVSLIDQAVEVKKQKMIEGKEFFFYGCIKMKDQQEINYTQRIYQN